MLLKVKRPFVGHGFNMPAPGTIIQTDDATGEYLLGIDVAETYEVKITNVPKEVKKGERLESSRPAQAPRKRTRRVSKKSVKKS